MHSNTIAGEQLGIGIVANSMEDVSADRLPVGPDSPMAAIDHPSFRPSRKTSKACFDRVRLKSVISIEETDVPGTSEMQAGVACARKPTVALPKQRNLGKVCEYRCRVHVRTIVHHDHLICRMGLSDNARDGITQKCD